MNDPKQKNERTIYHSDFAQYLPEALKKDPKMKAFAQAVTKQLLEVSGTIEDVLIYSRFEELQEELLDILAYDMPVDWYDYSYPLKLKREILKNSVNVHKKMGTKYAVENVLKSLHPGSRVEEWFEYGGTPHCFRVVINADKREYEIDLDKIMKSVNLYKRLSAHLESINLERKKEKKLYFMPVEAVYIRQKIKVHPYQGKVNKQANINTGIAALKYVAIRYRKK